MDVTSPLSGENYPCRGEWVEEGSLPETTGEGRRHGRSYLVKQLGREAIEYERIPAVL